MDGDSWNTNRSVCATRTSSHAVAQTERCVYLSVLKVQYNFVRFLNDKIR